MSTDQQIGFCTTADGVRIAYALVGEGPPLVKAPNWLTHLEFEWHSPVWRHWWQALAKDHLVVRFDHREAPVCRTGPLAHSRLMPGYAT